MTPRDNFGDALLALVGSLVMAIMLSTGSPASRVARADAAVPQATPRFGPIVLPSSLGSADPTHRVAVVVAEAIAAPAGTALAPMAGATGRYIAILADAATAIDEWSEGAVRVRFEITTTAESVSLTAVGERYWPDPAAVAAHVATEPTMLLVLWGPDGSSWADYAGIAGIAEVDGTSRPYLSLPDPGTIDGLPYPGEAIVHELLHGLETLSRNAGAPRIDLHHAANFGFAADAAGSWATWYRFFLTHPTIEAAQAVGHTPLWPDLER